LNQKLQHHFLACLIQQVMCKCFKFRGNLTKPRLPPPWLQGSAVPCGGAAGAFCVHHGAPTASPHWGRLADTHQPLGTCTQYRQKDENLHILTPEGTSRRLSLTQSITFYSSVPCAGWKLTFTCKTSSSKR